MMGSSTIMASGFENIIQHSYTDKDIIVRPLNVVHDSSQNYFQAKYIFRISQYYNKYLRDFLREKYDIDYAFDTLVGDNYFDMAELTVVDEHTIKLEGTYTTLTKLMNKLTSSGVKYSILSLIHAKKGTEFYNNGVIDPGFKPKIPETFVKMFYENGMDAVFAHDDSNYVLTIHEDET